MPAISGNAEIRAGLNFIGGNEEHPEEVRTQRQKEKGREEVVKIWVKCIDKKRVCQPTKDGKRVSRAFGRRTVC